jgi:hypothetical protein
MNPSVPQFYIDVHMAEDPARASAEYLARFRTDVEAFVSREVVDAAVAVQVPRMRPSEIMLDAHPLPSSRFSMVQTLNEGTEPERSGSSLKGHSAKLQSGLWLAGVAPEALRHGPLRPFRLPRCAPRAEGATDYHRYPARSAAFA